MGRKTDLQNVFDILYAALSFYYIPTKNHADDSMEITVDGKTFVISIKEKEDN